MLKDEEIDLVRQSVTMKQLAEAYGYKVNRSGKMCCPFHNDSSPSMQVYDGDRGYFCFVCSEGGSIFNFVMKHDGLAFEPAVRHIADMFGIPISDGKSELSKEDRQRIKASREKRIAAAEARNASKQRMTDISGQIHWFEYVQGEIEPLGELWWRLEAMKTRLKHEWEQLFDAIEK